MPLTAINVKNISVIAVMFPIYLRVGVPSILGKFLAYFGQASVGECQWTLAMWGNAQIHNANPTRVKKTPALDKRFVLRLEVSPCVGFYFGRFLAYLGSASVGEGWRTLAMAKYPTKSDADKWQSARENIYRDKNILSLR